jgi:hypothetical protein
MMLRPFFLLAVLTAASPALAAGESAGAAEGTLSWRLAFGGPRLETGYGLALGYRAADPAAPSGQLFEIDVSDRAAFARLAGLPLFGRDYRMSQDGDAGAQPAGASAKPWYTRQWVWWTVGGLATTAALGGGGGGDEEHCTGVCNQQNYGNTGTSASGVGDEGFGCVNDTCAVPCDADNKPAGCVGLTAMPATMQTLDYERLQWLDAGTGGMGDLIAR